MGNLPTGAVTATPAHRLPASVRPRESERIPARAQNHPHLGSGRTNPVSRHRRRCRHNHYREGETHHAQKRAFTGFWRVRVRHAPYVHDRHRSDRRRPLLTTTSARLSVICLVARSYRTRECSRRTVVLRPLMLTCRSAATTSSAAVSGTSTSEKRSAISIAPMSWPER
jgi:hypothetical protein